ncbi:aminoglycoside adenylyltransferase domain-containing protein [uncultured Ruminococcus sp.]|uniref:aminoglycoside adenylyltransferase domain-containing protein n=1 Tax=uncultured Ruminococcus sp. TaxID=165186 RepID=UPI0025FCB59E|nr:aminoglycoside adenylyltransferase domain-containing protein [uncultured Ruminococcus sp.]
MSKDTYSSLTDVFVRESIEILGDDLVGIYLHGSAVMGCFNPEKSDIDLIVVVSDTITDDIKRRFMKMVVALNEKAPAKGIEMSVVKAGVCRPFVYPTPFELHFSSGTLGWYKSDPEGYIQNMKGEDKDLAAHFTIVTHCGKTLYGKPIDEVFGAVDKAYFLDSIWCDIENAEEDILDDPMYIILNLTRVLAYCRDGLILSKKEGGEWGLENLLQKYHSLISAALDEYFSAEAGEYDSALAKEYAGYMLGEISPYVRAEER